ncbi:MAG: hypothetical protein ACR2H3_15990 [Acidimicrobiales bacterium]
MPAAQVAVAQPLGAGGEAEVFEVSGRPSVAYKRYRSPTPERAAKLDVMLRHPPAGIDDGGHVAIAWPTEIVEEHGRLAGFLMPRIDTKTTVPLFQVYNPQSRRQVAPGFSWRYLIRTARNVAAIVESLHDGGYVVGDLNESNFLVSRRALVTLVDCDSVQVVDPDGGMVHGCPVGKPEFLAPELQRADLSVQRRTVESDRFALAVLLHLLLLEGAHPFAGIWRGRGDPPDIGTRIAKRAAAHHRHGAVRPAPLALDLSVVPSPLARLFRRAFGPGLRFPSVRPSAGDWLAALDACEPGLVECSRSADHVHGAHLRRCPWCARLAVGLPDPFPGPTGPGLTPPPPTRAERVVATSRAAGRRTRATAGTAARRGGALVGGTVTRAGSSVWATVGSIVSSSVQVSVPRRLAAGALGLLAPVVALVAVAVALAVRTGVLRVRFVPRRKPTWRPTTAIVIGVAAAGAAVLMGWLASLGSGAPAGGAFVGLGRSIGPLRAAAAVAAGLVAHPLPWGLLDRAVARGERGLRWVLRWAAAVVLVIVAGPGGFRPSLAWPLDAFGRAVFAVLPF